MRISELINDSRFDKIRDEVFRFAVDMLDNYTEKVCDVGEKEIFDAVWGPVQFNSAEVAILDSPLLQRLRKIKQLGLANYVYCDADYSRFSHTVGVFFLAGKMAGMIQKKIKDNVKFNFVEIAKLSALFHDVGHMYFSHVSEYYFLEDDTFSRYEEVKAAIIEFSDVIDKKIALHEMLSVMIVQSPAVRKLLKKIASWMDDINIRNEKELSNLIEYISCMIVGVANDEDILPYHQIVNGSVDADKCDYLSRDSHATNVPVAVDIDRLVYKLTVEKEAEHGQKSQIWNGDESKKVYYLPAVKVSATEALNQLLMARTIMFKSVYYHQKVRTAEVMLRGIFAALNELNVKEISDFYYILKTTDSFFDENCYNLLHKDNDKVFNRKLKDITDKLNDLNNRFLLKRTCAVSHECIIGNKHDIYCFEMEVLKLNNHKKIVEIERLVTKEYKKIMSLLQIENEEENIFLVVEYPKYSPDHSKIDTKISYGNGETQNASQLFQAETWMGSKESRNKEHYLVSNSGNRELGFLAMQKVLYDMYHIVLDERASICTKVPIKDIRNYQKELWKKGYYNNAAVLIGDLLLIKYKETIGDLAQKYQTYEGEKGQTINENRIRVYLKQYLEYNFTDQKDIERLIDGVLRMLKEALFINRKNFDTNIMALFAQIRNEIEHLFICPLGGAKDSAKHITYYFNDFKEENLEIKSSLQEILSIKKDKSPIIFFDDGAYSGKQVLSIFQEYMGIPIENRNTQESHVEVLGKREQEILKKQKIILAYICFNEKNKQSILDGLKDLGLDNVEIIFSFNMSQKLFAKEKRVFADEQQKEIVEKCLSEIGEELIRSAKRREDGTLKENWSEERVMCSRLGYNDAQQIVILKSNVPTYTITSIWMQGGKYKGRVWMPLFSRTDK